MSQTGIKGLELAILPDHTDVPFGVRRFMKQTGSAGGDPPASGI
jgi:hypothetical protein